MDDHSDVLAGRDREKPIELIVTLRKPEELEALEREVADLRERLQNVPNHANELMNNQLEILKLTNQLVVAKELLKKAKIPFKY